MSRRLLCQSFTAAFLAVAAGAAGVGDPHGPRVMCGMTVLEALRPAGPQWQECVAAASAVPQAGGLVLSLKASSLVQNRSFGAVAPAAD